VAPWTPESVGDPLTQTRRPEGADHVATAVWVDDSTIETDAPATVRPDSPFLYL